MTGKQQRRDVPAGTRVQALRLAGRCADGAERDGGTVYHAVPEQAWQALCGARPGRSSAGWSTHPGPIVTCGVCAARVSRVVERWERWQGNQS